MFFSAFSPNPIPFTYYTLVFVPPEPNFKMEFENSKKQEQFQNSVKIEEQGVESHTIQKQSKSIAKGLEEKCSSEEKAACSKKQLQKNFKKNEIQKVSPRNPHDDEFVPNVPQIKKKRRTPQNSNRNVIPNIMHQIIAFLFRKKKSGNLVESIISKIGNEKHSSKRFYTFLSLMKEKINNYVNADALLILNELQDPSCQVYPEEEQRFYQKVCRIVIYYFFSNDFDMINLTSKRMKPEMKIEHLKMKRVLIDKFQQMLH